MANGGGWRCVTRRLLVALAIAVFLASCTSRDASDTTGSTTPSSVAVTETTVTGATSTVIPSTTFTQLPVEGSQVVVLVDGPVTAGPISAVVDADGRPLVVYVSSDDGSLRFLRCSDEGCAGPIEEVVLGYPGESQTVDMALSPDGSPAVVAWPWDYDGISLVYVCSDPECETVEVSELGDDEPCVLLDGRPCDWSVNYPSIVVPSDGLPRVVYRTQSDPVNLKLATCQTSDCQTWDWTTIDTLPAKVWTGAPSLRVDRNDRLVVSHWHETDYETQQSRVVVCEDPSCDAAPTVLTFDGVVFPQTTPGMTQDEFLVWYQTGSTGLPPDLVTDEAMEEGASAFPAIWSDYSDFMVATCASVGCEEPQYVEVGEDWLLPQAAGPLRLFVAADGSIGAFFSHASRHESDPQLHMTTCIDSTCTQGVTEALGIDTVLANHFAAFATNTAPGVVLVTNDGAIHLHTTP